MNIPKDIILEFLGINEEGHKKIFEIFKHIIEMPESGTEEKKIGTINILAEIEKLTLEQRLTMREMIFVAFKVGGYLQLRYGHVMKGMTNGKEE